MTDAQSTALKKAKEILDEHFESYIVTVKAEVDDGGDIHPSFWHGGFAAAYGLAHLSIDNMRNHEREDDEKMD